MLSDAAQQSLPQDAQVALQQVDNREYLLAIDSPSPASFRNERAPIAKYHHGLCG